MKTEEATENLKNAVSELTKKFETAEEVATAVTETTQRFFEKMRRFKNA